MLGEREENAENVGQFMSVSNDTPEQAIRNIDNANFSDMGVESYTGLKDELEVEVENASRIPAQVSNGVKEYTTQNTQTAALAKPDLWSLEGIEANITHLWHKTYTIPENNQRISELSVKRYEEGGLDESEIEEMEELKGYNNELLALTPVDEEGELVHDVLSSSINIIRPYAENKALLATMVAGGAVVGAGAGSLVAGIGAIPGAALGVGQALTVGTAVVGFKASWDARGNIYDQLENATDEEGNPLNIPSDKIQNVGMAVAGLQGVLSAGALSIITKTNPLAKRIFGSKQVTSTLTKSPALLAKMDLIGGLFKGGLAEGFEEGAQEFIGIVGDAFAKLEGSDEGSIGDVLDGVYDAIKSSSTIETGKQVAKSAAMGAVSAGLFQGVTGVAGYKGAKRSFEKQQVIEQQRVETLETQNSMIEVAERMKTTSMDKLAPEQMGVFTKMVYKGLGVDEKIWYDHQAAENLEGESKLKIRELMKESSLGAEFDELNLEGEMTKSDLIQVAKSDPSALDYMKLTPEGETPHQIKTNAQVTMERIQEFNDRRSELIEGLDTEGINKVDAELDALAAEVMEGVNALDRNDYLETQPFEVIDEVVSQEQADQLNSEHLDVRLEVEKQVSIEVEEEVQKVQNKIITDIKQKKLRQELIEHRKGFQVKDRFADTKNKSEAAKAVTESHKKKGYSPSAIDPTSLPEDLKEIYLVTEKFKNKKVFVEGGLHIDEAAVLNGVESGAELLRLLDETPTKLSIRNKFKKGSKESTIIENRVKQTTRPFAKSKRDQAFTDRSKMIAKEMRFMLDNQWNKTKKGIKKITGRIPSITALNAKSKSMVQGMKLKELSANRFVQGLRKSQTLARDAYLEGEVGVAMKQKEKAIMNNELRKESVNALEKVTSNKKFWKRVKSKRSQKTLQDAGMLEAMQEYTDVYILEGVEKGKRKKEAYLKYLKESADNGSWVNTPPLATVETRASIDDLTVEQYQEITDGGKAILQQARLKNKLFQIQKKRNAELTLEHSEQVIAEQTENHPDYDPEKARTTKVEDMTTWEKTKDLIYSGTASLGNMKTIATQLDNYKEGGVIYRMFVEPMKNQMTVKRRMNQTEVEIDKKLITDYYGIDKFNNEYVNGRVNVPEFAGIDALGDGKGNIRKADLLVLLAYMGDPDGKVAMENFGNGLNSTVIMKTLNKHLTSNDLKFSQEFFAGKMERHKEASYILHKKMTGTNPEMIEGVEVTLGDVTTQGGYYPLQFVTDFTKEQAESTVQKLEEKGTKPDEQEFFARQRAAESTKQGRFKARKGSNKPLDIKFENVFKFTEDIIHDLTFREVTMNSLKMLKSEENSRNIKSVVGKRKYETMLKGVVDLASNGAERENTIYEKNFIEKWIDKGHNLHAVSVIAYNPASAAIQMESLSNVLLRGSKKTKYYMANQLAEITANPHKYFEAVKLAATLNPDIGFEQDGIDETTTKHLHDYLDTDQVSLKSEKATKAVNKFNKFKKFINQLGFSGLREMDRFNRVLTTLSTAEEFMNGDIEGYDLERLQGMTEKQKAKAMRSVIQQRSDLSLTASSIIDLSNVEKDKRSKMFTRYYVDLRSKINTTLATLDQSRQAFSAGDKLKAMIIYGRLASITGAAAASTEMIRGLFSTSSDEDEDVTLLEKARNLLLTIPSAPVKVLTGSLPLVRDAEYAFSSTFGNRKTVSTPLLGATTNIATAAAATRDVILDIVEGEDASVNRSQRKAIVHSLGYSVGGVPTGIVNKIIDAIDNKEIEPGEALKTVIEQTHSLINGLFEKYEGDKSKQGLLEELKEYQAVLPQTDKSIDSIIPPDIMETIQSSMSQGEWFKVDEETGAAGLYQYTEEAWEDLMLTNPDLEITEEGRTAKDQSEQETAIEWEIENNALAFKSYGIPVNGETLLGAHKFGFDNFIAIYESKSSSKLNKVLGAEYKDNPVFKGFKTVKAVKEYLKSQT